MITLNHDYKERINHLVFMHSFSIGGSKNLTMLTMYKILYKEKRSYEVANNLGFIGSNYRLRGIATIIIFTFSTRINNNGLYITKR